MIAITPGIKGLLNELLLILDQEIELLEVRLTQVSAMHSAILDRDEPATEKLLSDLETTQQRQIHVDMKMGALRGSLSTAFRCRAGEVKLSFLIARVDADLALPLDYRRRRIVALVEELRRQHVRTALLLRECARINRTLLEGLLSGCGTLTTYGSGGKNHWHARSGVVDTEG